MTDAQGEGAFEDRTGCPGADGLPLDDRHLAIGAALDEIEAALDEVAATIARTA